MKAAFWALLAYAVFLATPVLAQVPSSEEPGAAAARFESRVGPRALSGETIRLPANIAPVGAGAIELQLVGVKIVGGTVYGGTELTSIYEAAIGTRVTLARIYDIARGITSHYGDDGYVLSRAFIPEQELDPANAIVTIQVVEAYVDRVQWPASAARYRDLFSDYAEKITAERPSNIRTVMRYLLLAGDLPGLTVTSRFEASQDAPSASTLVVELTEKPADAALRVDNRGTEGRGPWQHMVTATFNNLLGQHEAITGMIAGSLEWEELTYASLAYRQVLNSEGLELSGALSYSTGAPGTPELQALEFQSTSLSGSLGLTLPVVRSRETNVGLSANAFFSDNSGSMLGAPSSDDRLRGLRLTAAVDHADEFDGTMQGVITLSRGFEGLGSSANGNPLASRENGRVDFTTLEGSIARTQKLGGGWSIYGAVKGQLAATPLLAPEECGFGGETFGRGFDPSEITGDHCLFVGGELRFSPDIDLGPLTGAQIYGFVDHGTVWRMAPAAGVATEASGASAGLGVRLDANAFNLDLSAARPLYGRADDGWRFFLSANAKY